MGNLGLKDQAVVDRILRLAEDEKQEGYIRLSCAESIGKLGEKQKAVEILIGIYLAHSDKYEDEARQIYSSLWDLTAV